MRVADGVKVNGIIVFRILECLFRKNRFQFLSDNKRVNI